MTHSENSDGNASASDVERLLREGNRLEDGGDFDGALQSYRAAERVDQAHPRIALNIANALQAAGRLDDAARTLRDALIRQPDLAAARFNLAAILAAQDLPGEAETELREALRIDPTMAEAAVRLAAILESAERYDEAEVELRRAMEIQPGNAGAVLNLGALYLRQDRYVEAEEWITRAASMDPSPAAIHSQLGVLYLKTGRYEKAYDAFVAAMAQDPDELSVGTGLLFSLNFRTDVDPVVIAREHRRIGAALALAAGKPIDSWHGTVEADRRLKIGYVSGDLRQHPVGLFMRPVLSHHDRERFEIHCFCNQSSDDDVTRVLREPVQHWHRISKLNDDRVAELIHEQAIDVLVDLSGHTDRNRLSVFARRPAPVQATWLGYLNTTGLPTMDYRICDHFTDPLGETEHLHTETLHRVPFSQWCYLPYFELPPVTKPHAERPDAIVFGSFNQFGKISDACLDLWCEILARVPKAELTVFDVTEGWRRETFVNRLLLRNVDLNRVRLRNRGNIFSYCNAISNVDIALDTFPYNGATTTLDTLWMGTPLIALRGDRGISRGSFSIISSLGLPELIASSPEEYVDANVRLASDHSWRSQLRATLRERMSASPLMNASAFTAGLEDGYRQMWRAWCSVRA